MLDCKVIYKMDLQLVDTPGNYIGVSAQTTPTLLSAKPPQKQSIPIRNE